MTMEYIVFLTDPCMPLRSWLCSQLVPFSREPWQPPAELGVGLHHGRRER